MTERASSSGGRRPHSEPPSQREPLGHRPLRASTRRRALDALDVLSTLLGLGAFAVLLLALSAGRSVAGTTLEVALSAEAKSLDPHVTTSLNDFRVLANVYDGLVRFAPGSLEVEPSLAESYTVSADGESYVFRLRRDVEFHDGTPFDAEAVKFNLERMTDAKHPYHHTGPFPLAFFFENVREVRVEDRHTVRLRLDRPFAPLLSNLAYPVGFMVSPSAVRRHGAEFGRHGAGTGAFRVVAWETGGTLVLQRFERHFRGPPALSSIVFRPITDRLTRVAELRRNGVDLVPEVGADNVDWFRRSPRFVVHQAVGPHVWFMLLNARRPPFDDVNMRRAVNLAVNRQALVDRALAGTATVAAGVIPEAFSRAKNPRVEPYPHDPERASRLIREAGHQGMELTCLVPKGGSGMLEPELMATAIQADLASVGLSVRIETYEWNAYLARVNRGLSDGEHMAAMAWMTNDPDTLPYLALRSGAHPPNGFNSGWYANAEVDRLVEAARRAVAPAERAMLYQQLDRVVHDDAPFLFVASWKQAAVTSSEVNGFQLEPSFFLKLDRVEKR